MYILNIYFVYLHMKKDTQILMKLSEAEKEGFKRASEITGEGFSGWARRLLRAEATKVLQENGETVPFLTSNKPNQNPS